MPNGACPPQGAASAGPTLSGQCRPTVSSSCFAGASRLGRLRPPPAPSAPPPLRAGCPSPTRHRHSPPTLQARLIVRDEPSSAALHWSAALWAGAAAPAMGRDRHSPSLGGRHMLLGETHALWSHRGCRQDPPVPRAWRGRERQAARSQPQRRPSPALPLFQAPAGRRQAEATPASSGTQGPPVPTVPGTGSGWQGGRGGHQRKQGAQGQGRHKLP